MPGRARVISVTYCMGGIIYVQEQTASFRNLFVVRFMQHISVVALCSSLIYFLGQI